jgi:hypothetical protein
MKAKSKEILSSDSSDDEEPTSAKQSAKSTSKPAVNGSKDDDKVEIKPVHFRFDLMSNGFVPRNCAASVFVDSLHLLDRDDLMVYGTLKIFLSFRNIF